MKGIKTAEVELRGYPEMYLLTGFDLRHIGNRRYQRPILENQANPIESAITDLT
jgi:hypothetical protein